MDGEGSSMRTSAARWRHAISEYTLFRDLLSLTFLDVEAYRGQIFTLSKRLSTVLE
jgi:hypothetical protein